MKKEELDALQAKSEAATQGEWMHLPGDRFVYDRMEDGCRGNSIVGVDYPPTFYDQHARNLDFVAAANPQTVSWMIARIRELEGDTSKSAEAGRTLAKADIEYPRDVFSDLILNNSPYAFYLFQWVPYQTDAKRWRLKMCHDVRTFDGREAHGIWPNGSHCGPFRDDEVEFIRISRSQYGEAWEDPRHAAPSAGRVAPEGGK